MRQWTPYVIRQRKYGSNAQWPSVALFDLRKMISSTSPTGEIIHFKAIFDDYTSILATELALNLTKGRELFGRIRNESTCYSFSAQSMNDRSRLFYRANLLPWV